MKEQMGNCVFTGEHRSEIEVEGVQTEVDAGYEGESKLVLVEAKNSRKDAATDNAIIRQMYYPFRQWSQHTSKPVELLFFEKRQEHYCIWKFTFADKMDYNSIQLVSSARYTIDTTH